MSPAVVLRVAVDLGTTNTCAAMSLGGTAPQMVVVDGAPVLPSAVYLAPDGGLYVGQEARQQAAIDPARYEPHPKLRLGEDELLLGDTVVPVVEVVRAVLARMVGEARRAAGGAPVDQLVLTHPADWGSLRPGVLRRAAVPLARDVVLIAEPVAAALFVRTGTVAGADFATSPAAQETVLAVLDLGGGTVDASVVWWRGADTTVVATRGDATFGGADIDEALLAHIGARCSSADPVAWRTLTEGRELADRRRRRALLVDVRTAKETLSRHPYVDVPLPHPFPDVHLTRSELERLVAPALGRAVDLLEATLADAGCAPGQTRPDGVFLVGGSSRIPLVARLVHQRTGLAPLILDVPETVVARGALHSQQGVPRVEPGFQDPAEPAQPTQPPQRGRRSRRRSRGLLGGVLVAGVAVVLAGYAVTDAGDVGDAGDTATRVAAYGYSFELLPGWEQAGGDDSLQEVRLVPAGTEGPDAMVVQRNELDYDSDAEPGRPARELRDQLSDTHLAVTHRGRFTGLDPDAGFAGRDVLHYREHPADGSTVDWYLLFRRRAQVSVGCRHTTAFVTHVERACREVVRTLQIR